MEGAYPKEWRAPTYYFGQILPKTAWKWKKLDREGEGRPKIYCVDPPLEKFKIIVINQNVPRELIISYEMTESIFLFVAWVIQTVTISCS